MADVGMIIKVVSDELEKYKGLCVEDVAEAVAEAGKIGLDTVQRLSPVLTGNYKRGWRLKKTKTANGAEAIVYNDKKPRLTHLLENGRLIVQGKNAGARTKAQPHIAPAQDAAAEAFERILTEKLEGKQ